MVWPLGTRAFLIIGSELLANVMLHLMPREACTAASVCRAWHTGVALSGRLRSVLFLNGTDCAWTARVLTRVFARFSLLEELHFSTEALLPLEAVAVIVRCFSSSLRSLSAFVVSNSVQGRQPAVSELAKITTLESL
ncbi:MAG: F-box protein, partial [Promethearchaeia archaeon]